MCEFLSSKSYSAESPVSRSSPRKRNYLQNHCNLLIRGPGGFDSWQKISWHCLLPFHPNDWDSRGTVHFKENFACLFPSLLWKKFSWCPDWGGAGAAPPFAQVNCPLFTNWFAPWTIHCHWMSVFINSTGVEMLKGQMHEMFCKVHLTHWGGGF